MICFFATMSLFCLMQGVSAQDGIKVMSFNIRYNSVWENDGDNKWDNRKEAVVAMLMEERPAAIGLQEALIDQLEYLDKNLEGYKRVGVGRDDGKAKGEFMAVYYDTKQLELMSEETKWLSETPDEPSRGWDAACNRTVTVTRLRDMGSGQEFCYLNTHLDHVGKKAREESTMLLAELVRNEGEEMPVIVGGDMNSTIEDPIFRSLEECGLKSAREMAEESSDAITYNGFGKSEGSVIDHFFVRGMKVFRFKTLDGDYGVKYVSDHYAVVVEVGIEG